MATKVKLKDTAGQQVYPEIDATDKGTVVVANPSDMGTADLSKIKINNTIYNIGGGGGTNVFYINCAVNNLDEKLFLPIAETPTRQEVYEAIVAGKTVLARAKIQNQEWDVDYNYYALFVGCFGVSSLECVLYYISDEMIKLDSGP